MGPLLGTISLARQALVALVDSLCFLSVDVNTSHLVEDLGLNRPLYRSSLRDHAGRPKLAMQTTCISLRSCGGAQNWLRSYLRLIANVGPRSVP